MSQSMDRDARDPGLGPVTGAVEEALLAVCQSAARRASERLPDGVALVFLLRGPQAFRLRASAGPCDPAGLGPAAGALRPELEALQREGGPRAVPAPTGLAEAAPRGLLALSPEHRGRRHAALLVGGPREPSAATRRDLDRIAARLAERIDHLLLEAEAARLHGRLHAQTDAAERKGEEILKLSEALFAQDIELLRKDEKLGKVERLKNDFIEKMSCELRTPLNGIIEAIIAVLANENEALSESAKTGLRSALDDGTSFLRTLQNILDLWRVKQGELPVELHEVNYREVVDEAIFSAQDTLAGKAIRIEKRFQDPFPKIRTDLAKVNQILFLLLDNAAKFTEHGRIEIRSAVRDGELACAVEDTGIGICPDDQQFIFEAFYQVDDPGSSRFRGAGLGLALVHDLVTLLGGSLEVSSEVGRGSTFVFRVPVEIVA